MGIVHFQTYLTALPKLIVLKVVKGSNNISFSEKKAGFWWQWGTMAKKTRRGVYFERTWITVTWLHEAFNCNGDNTGKGMLAVPCFHGNRYKQKKKNHQFTRLSETLLCYVQSIFASMQNNTKPIADLAKLAGNSEEMAQLTATQLKCWD